MSDTPPPLSPESCANLGEFVLSAIKETGFFSVVSKIFSAISRFLMVSRFLRYTIYILLWIETSAIFIAATVAFLILIPVIALASAMAFFSAHRANRRFAASLDAGRHKIVFTHGHSASVPDDGTIIIDTSLLFLLFPPQRLTDGRIKVSADCFYLIRKKKP